MGLNYKCIILNNTEFSYSLADMKKQRITYIIIIIWFKISQPGSHMIVKKNQLNIIFLHSNNINFLEVVHKDIEDL